jgi:hypothetical protein
LELVLVTVRSWVAPLGGTEKHDTAEAFKIKAKTANMYMALLMLRSPMMSVRALSLSLLLRFSFFFFAVRYSQEPAPHKREDARHGDRNSNSNSNRNRNKQNQRTVQGQPFRRMHGKSWRGCYQKIAFARRSLRVVMRRQGKDRCRG